MTVVAVTFDGTRLDDSDDETTGWGNFQPSTGGAPASEGSNAYQISTGAAADTGVVGRQSQSTTGRRGIDFNDAGTVDYASNGYLWYVKCVVSDSFDLNTTWGVEVAIGTSDTGDDHRYNIAGSGANLPVYGAYPPQGGYLITCIDPVIDAWKETENGTFDQTDVTWYAMGAQMINGNAKSENVGLDAIDYGTGLTLLNGTGADDPGKYTDYVVADQDDQDKRWGAAVGGGNNAILRGVMTVGASGTATEFDDSTSVVTFPDGYHSRGAFGVNMDIQNASSVIADGALLIGEGTRNGVDANDTRPDYTVTGTSGAYTWTGQMRNFRDVTFTSVCDVAGEIECMLLVQNSANIENAIIKTNALTSVACLQDPTFGTTTDLNNTTFIQTGAGHAIEIDTAGDYTLTNLFGLNVAAGGYGANTTDDAALDLTAATGTYNITVDGGDTPTYKKQAGATVNIITTVITLSVTVLDATDDTPLTTATVRLMKDSDKSVLLNGAVNGSGVLSDTISYDADTDVVGWAREHNVSGTDYTQQDFSGEYTVNGFSIIIRLEPAE